MEAVHRSLTQTLYSSRLSVHVYPTYLSEIGLIVRIYAGKYKTVKIKTGMLHVHIKHAPYRLRIPLS